MRSISGVSWACWTSRAKIVSRYVRIWLISCVRRVASLRTSFAISPLVLILKECCGCRIWSIPQGIILNLTLPTPGDATALTSL